MSHLQLKSVTHVIAYFLIINELDTEKNFTLHLTVVVAHKAVNYIVKNYI